MSDSGKADRVLLYPAWFGCRRRFNLAVRQNARWPAEWRFEQGRAPVKPAPIGRSPSAPLEARLPRKV
jgi:hypothetical protein